MVQPSTLGYFVMKVTSKRLIAGIHPRLWLLIDSQKPNLNIHLNFVLQLVSLGLS